jgi:hypothetical protein
MYTYIILFLPPIRICRDTSCYRIPSQSSSSHVQSLPLGILFLKIPSILHLFDIIWPLGTLIKLSNKICISNTIQTMLWPIVSKNFFHTDIIEHLYRKSIPFCHHLGSFFHLIIISQSCIHKQLIKHKTLTCIAQVVMAHPSIHDSHVSN